MSAQPGILGNREQGQDVRSANSNCYKLKPLHSHGCPVIVKYCQELSWASGS